VDLAEELGVPLARISAATRSRLAAVLEPGLPATNPLDAWGTGNDADAIFAACIRALLGDPDTGALAVALDLTTEPTPETSYAGLAIEAARSTAKPVAVLANLASAVDRADAARLRAAGVPVLEGTATGLAALRHLLAHRDVLAHPRRRAGRASHAPAGWGGRRRRAGRWRRGCHTPAGGCGRAGRWCRPRRSPADSGGPPWRAAGAVAGAAGGPSGGG
jgi:acyl-CoA synthetase (NDP forming)